MTPKFMEEQIFDNNFKPKDLPLRGEIFTRKEEIGKLLVRLREESRQREAKNHSAARSRSLKFLRWGIAASVAVLVGLFGYGFSNVTIETADNQASITLPDASKVNVMENSTLAYNRVAWLFKRDLTLSGKASFEVAKGKQFTVNTDAGSVSVLGTKFLVDQEAENMHVDCFEGHVEVKTNIGKTELKAGESVDCSAKGLNKIEEKKKEEEPRDKAAEETKNFEETPLIDVINEMEKLYGITVSPKELCKGYTYSGLFLTNDRDATLEMVFGACGITYSITGNEVHIEVTE